MKLFRREKQDSMRKTVERAHKFWGLEIDFVVDVGAADGKWSHMCSHIYTDARYILIEPLDEREALLAALVEERGWAYHKFAAGADKGTVDFYVSDDLDGSGVSDGKGESVRPVEVRPLDSLLPLTGRGLLKLDTHGFEKSILEGAKKLIDQIDLAIIEVYGHPITNECLVFDELCMHMRTLGFRAAWITDLMMRPSDATLWQADIFFLRESHPVFRNRSFQ